MTGGDVVRSEDKHVVDRLGIARFVGLAGTVDGVGVEGLGFVAEVDTLDDAIEHGAFGVGDFLFTERRAQQRTSQSVGNLSVAGDADGAVIFLCMGPVLPPDLAVVEVLRGCGFVPCARGSMRICNRRRSGMGRKADGQNESRDGDVLLTHSDLPRWILFALSGTPPS